MKNFVSVLLLVKLIAMLTGCSGSPYRHLSEGEVIEGRYVNYAAPDAGWNISKGRNVDSWSSGISAHQKGASYHITVQSVSLSEPGGLFYFDKNAEYVQILKDEDMQLTENDREQGIGYVRNWTSYAMGLRCVEGVFSRNGGGLMASITSKNYGISCGYYHKTEGRRVLDISYRYNYAGGSVRHEADKNTPREELLTREQAEMGLKLAVKKIVESLQIKNMDRQRMEREGLLYVGKEYVISPY